MKRIVIVVALCATQAIVFAGSGGAVAGGLIGGAVLGSMIASANQPRYVESAPQTVVIRDEPRRERIVREVVCVNERGDEVPCPERRRLSDRPDNY